MLEVSAKPRSFAEGKVLAAQEDGVGFVTFNNPEKHNAMTGEMRLAIVEILDEWEQADAVRVVVFSGAGGKAFVSGGDLSQAAKQDAGTDAARNWSEVRIAAATKLTNFPKPTIASIRGYCLGGGLALALQTDLRIAATGSQFGIPTARLGNVYDGNDLRTLVAHVGPGNARMILYTGRRISAEEAERIGLINQVVPEEQLDEVVLSLAREIAAGAPLTARATKFAINDVLKDPGDRDLETGRRLRNAAMNSEDFREGNLAFREKRPPQFKGR